MSTRIRRPVSGRTNRAQLPDMNLNTNVARRTRSRRPATRAGEERMELKRNLSEFGLRGNRSNSLANSMGGNLSRARSLSSLGSNSRPSLSSPFLVNANHLVRARKDGATGSRWEEDGAFLGHPHSSRKKLDKDTEEFIRSISNVLQKRYDGKASLRKVFLAWDVNRDGHVDPVELRGIFAKCGCPVTKEQAASICSYFGVDGNEKIAYDGFIDLIFKEKDVEVSQYRKVTEDLRTRLRELGLNEQQVEHVANPKPKTWRLDDVIPRLKKKYQAKSSLAREFRHIDDNKDGLVSKQELQDVLERQGFHVLEEDIEALFSKFDKSHDGSVQYSEFIKVVFPPKDQGAFVHLTPRSIDDEDAEEETKLEVDETDKGATKEGSEEGDVFGDEEIPTNVNIAVRDVLRAARVRDRVSKKLGQDFGNTAKAFKQFDQNGDGRISHAEFKQAILNLDIGMNDEDAEILLHYVDQDGSGYVEFEEFWERITSRFGAPKAEPKSSSGAQSMTASNANGGGDYNITNTKTATVSNIGMVVDRSAQDMIRMRKTRLQRKLFPKHNLKNTSHGRRVAQAERDKLQGNSKREGGSLKPVFDVTRLHKALEVPTRRAHTPIHDTTHLITPPLDANNELHGDYLISNEERFSRESQRYSTGSEHAYHNNPERVRQRQRRENRIERKRRLMQHLENKAEDNNTVAHDPERRLRTLVKHRLFYFTRLQERFEKDQVKWASAGY